MSALYKTRGIKKSQLCNSHSLHIFSSIWVSRTGSASDWCALQEALYKCIDTIQYNTLLLKVPYQVPFYCQGRRTQIYTILNKVDRVAHDCWVPRQFVYGHFVYDTSSTDISSTDISFTTVYQRTGQLYIQLLFQQFIIFINSNFYLHYDSFLSIPLPLTI